MTISQLGSDREEQLAQVVDEFFDDVAKGETPEVSDYLRRYPEIADHLKIVIPAMLATEHAASRSEPMSFQDKVPREKQLGDFRILRQIGRGGMGVVYEAEQVSMRRRVALKVLPLAGLVDELKIHRFQNEVRAVAALNHPNIVPVYMVGQERGVHYYAMQLIHGRSLSDVISSLQRVRDDGNPLDGASISQITNIGRAGDAVDPGLDGTGELTQPDVARDAQPATCETVAAEADGSTIPHSSRREYLRSVAALGIQAASALQHAHEQGVVHRDIKPANLLLDSSATLFVTDFGLARMESDVGVTMTGDLIGTLRYMAPEQALAKRVVVDHRADIYSLGVTLYELIALQPAYRAEDRQQLLKQIAFEEPTPLRRLDREIPTELETIIHKAMSKDMDQRYTSAQELADDLRLHLENRPIKAKPPTTSEIIGKWTRRNPILTWATIITLSLVTLTLAVSTLLISRQLTIATSAQELEELAREESTARASELARHNYLMHIANADRALLEKKNTYSRARVELDACPQELRGWEWHFLDVRIRATIIHRFPGAEQPIFTRDGKRLIAIGALGTPEERIAHIWDLSSGKLDRTLTHEFRLSHIAMSPDEKRVAGGDDKGNLFVWDTATSKKLWTAREHAAKFDGLAFSPDGNLIASANWDKTLKIFDAKNGHVRNTVGCEESLRKVMFSPDGRWISSAGIKGQTKAMIIDVATGEIAATFPGEGNMIPTFDPSGRRIATSNRDGSIALWDWDGKQPTMHRSWQASASHHVFALDFSADGEQLVSGDIDNGVKVWDVSTGHEGKELVALGTRVGAYWLATAPSGGDLVAFFTPLNGIHVWQHGEDTESLIVKPVDGPAAASFSPDGRQIVVSVARESLAAANVHRDAINQGRKVSVRDAASGAEVLEIEGNLHSASWTPDGRYIVAAADPQRELRIHSTSTGELTNAITGDTSLFAGFALSEQQLELVLIDGAIRVRDLQSGEETEVSSPGRLEDEDLLIEVDISRNNALVAVAFGGFRVEIWDVQTKKRVQSLAVPGEWVRHIAFSQDGDDLYVGSSGGRLTGFDIHSGAAQVFTGHADRVTAIATSPDGDQIVGGDRTGCVIVWDVANAQPIVTLTDVGQPIVSLDWSPDGRRIVAGKEDGSIQIWTLPSSP